MLKCDVLEVRGFESAIQAMRNPMNSWSNSDSAFTHFPNIGEKDMELMRKLFKAGVEHRTYARMIHVWMEIEAPLYWWKEMDRYTVGKNQISTSTMHKIHAQRFSVSDFSKEHLIEGYEETLIDVIDTLNWAREQFIETKDKKYWWQMIQLLPSSYNQKRTVEMSYEVCFKIIRERKGHKLDEWDMLIRELYGLPYLKSMMGEE